MSILRKNPEPVAADRWQGPYGIFMTLLFALFVVLYANSEATKKELKGKERLASEKKDSKQDKFMSSEQIAEVLQLSLKEAFQEQDGSQKFEIAFVREGVSMRLAASELFEVGMAEVRPEAISALNKIALRLKQTNLPIRVEGHTDNSKVRSEYYSSNWELSTARASWIVRYFIQNHQFSPEQLSAAGYAEFHPIADNSTDIGKAKNRRVELVVINNR